MSKITPKQLIEEREAVVEQLGCYPVTTYADKLAIDAMAPSDLGLTGVLAAFKGDKDVLAIVRKRLGVIPVSLSFDGGEIAGALASGETFRLPLGYCMSNQWWQWDRTDLEELMRLILELSGGEELISRSPWGLILQPLYEHDLEYESEIGQRNTPLPVLCAGRVVQSGVLQALHEKVIPGFSASWFDDTLCWATSEDIALHGEHLLPLDGVFQVEGVTAGGKREVIRIRGALPDGVDEVASVAAIDSIRFGFEGLGRDANIVDNELIRHFLGSEYQGVCLSNDGLRLCRTTVSFLSQFMWDEVADIQPYLDRVETYFPMKLISAKANQALGVRLGSETYDPDAENKLTGILTAREVTPQQVFEVMALRPVERASLKKMLPQTLSAQIVRQGNQKARYSPEIMQRLMSSLDVEVPNLRLNISMANVQPTTDAEQVGIPAGSDIQFHSFERDSERMSAKRFSDLLARCEGPVTFEGIPSDAAPAEILRLYTEGKLTASQQWAMTEMARRAGLEAFEPHLGAGYWDAAMDFFGTDAVAPHIGEVDDRVATRAMTLGLDL